MIVGGRKEKLEGPGKGRAGATRRRVDEAGRWKKAVLAGRRRSYGAAYICSGKRLSQDGGQMAVNRSAGRQPPLHAHCAQSLPVTVLLTPILSGRLARLHGTFRDEHED